MVFLNCSLCFIAGLSATTVLVLYDHPIFAVIVLLMTSCISFDKYYKNNDSTT